MNRAWRRYLFVSPHADDVEFGCGGLLARLADDPDAEAHVLVLASRETTTGEAWETTLEYQRDALRALGLEPAQCTVERLPSRRLPDVHEEVRQALAREGERFDPDVIFTTPQGDRMQDHHAAAMEVSRVFRGKTILEYEVVSSSVGFVPDGYIEISTEELKRKIAALRCHRGQCHKPYFDAKVIESLARLRGAQSGSFELAEGFHTRAMLWPSPKPAEVRLIDHRYTEETPDFLGSRIEAHRKLSKHEVEDFIAEHSRPQPGEVVVDLCAGSGKQSLAAARAVGREGHVLGLELKPELVAAARQAAGDAFPQLEARQHDCNEPIPMPDAGVDLLTCCYGIYYLEDFEAVVREIRRVLKPGGRLFVIGPARDNNEELRSLHARMSGTQEPLAITRYRQRIEEELRPLLERDLEDVEAVPFHNELRFVSTETFDRYYRSTALLAKSSEDPAERDRLARRMKDAVAEHLKRHEAFVVRKTSLALKARSSASRMH